MQKAQRVVVKWMKAQLAKGNDTPSAWAKRAKLAPTTITRAMRPTYTSVTSLPTLSRLAEAADVPSVIDFLLTQIGDDGIMPGPVPLLLGEVLRAAGVPNHERLVQITIDASLRIGSADAKGQRDPEFIRAAVHVAMTK